MEPDMQHLSAAYMIHPVLMYSPAAFASEILIPDSGFVVLLSTALFTT